jgi:hypothetical protein
MRCILLSPLLQYRICRSPVSTQVHTRRAHNQMPLGPLGPKLGPNHHTAFTKLMLFVRLEPSPFIRHDTATSHTVGWGGAPLSDLPTVICKLMLI